MQHATFYFIAMIIRYKSNKSRPFLNCTSNLKYRPRAKMNAGIHAHIVSWLKLTGRNTRLLELHHRNPCIGVLLVPIYQVSLWHLSRSRFDGINVMLPRLHWRITQETLLYYLSVHSCRNMITNLYLSYILLIFRFQASDFHVLPYSFIAIMWIYTDCQKKLSTSLEQHSL